MTRERTGDGSAARQFGRMANVYAEAEDRRYPEDFILGLCDPDEDDLHLDVGTGPGTIAGILAPLVGGVVGTDVSPEMLDLFETRTPGGRSVLADAHRLPFNEGSFTLVTCGSVFHHLEDPASAVDEVARVLRPGGRFLLIDMAGPENPGRREARDEVERVRDPSHVHILAPSRVHAFLEAAGFEIKAEERQVEDKRDEDWARVAGADLEKVREALRLRQKVAAGFLALRWEGDGFIMRRERAYYLAVRL
jgi:ubiquinone/menaquinone biosynthesis C-methylase UbiE